MVVPSSARSWRMCAHRLARFCGSIPVDGSSRNSSFGEFIRPRATSSRRRCPPDSEPTVRFSSPVRSRLATSSAARAVVSAVPQSVEPALGVQLVQHPEAVPAAVALADVADPGAHQGRLADDVRAGDLGGPRGGRQQGRQHPQRGGLAGAVGPEKGHQLTGVDVDVHALDGVDGLFPARELLAQLAGVNHAWVLPLVGRRAAPDRMDSRVHRISVRRTELLTPYTVRSTSDSLSAPFPRGFADGRRRMPAPRVATSRPPSWAPSRADGSSSCSGTRRRPRPAAGRSRRSLWRT